MTSPTNATAKSVDLVRELLHVVTSPSSPLVTAVVMENLRSIDRRRWYPSLLLEGYEDDRGQQGLADDARLLGVPVAATRSPRGVRGIDDVRLFLDEWFYVRNMYPSMIHVHGTAVTMRSSAVERVGRVLRQTPIVASVYPPREVGDASGSVKVDVRRAGRSVAHGTLGVSALRDANWLYAAVLAAHRRR